MAVVLGCTTTAEHILSADGTFSGTMPNGGRMVLTLSEEAGGFSGHGTSNGKPFAVSGGRVWQGVGTMSSENGSFLPLDVSLSGDAETLTLVVPGKEAYILERGGQPVPQAPGPFSGSYRSESLAPLLVRLTLVQQGRLISGVAGGLGMPVGFAGRATEPRKMSGVLTFLDGSQVSIDAELSPDGRSLTISGLGAPMVFTNG